MAELPPATYRPFVGVGFGVGVLGPGIVPKLIRVNGMTGVYQAKSITSTYQRPERYYGGAPAYLIVALAASFLRSHSNPPFLTLPLPNCLRNSQGPPARR
jgi:hypothetical protein